MATVHPYHHATYCHISRHSLRAFLVLLLVFSGFLLTSRAQVALDEVRSGELLLLTDTPGAYEPATQLSTKVNMHISGLVARVTLSQNFENTGERWAEAIYVFPLPEDAAVDTLTMRIGERVIEGEIKEREEAQTIYSEAKEAGQQTSLVEQERPNLFTTSVANIAPGETITIEIGYQETLRYDAGSFSLRFPLAITPRYIPETVLVNQPVADDSTIQVSTAVNDAERISPPYYRGQDGNPVTIEATINAGFALAKLESRYHEVDIRQEGNLYHVALKGEIPADRDFELVWSPDVGSVPEAAAFSESWQNESYALVMLLPPQLENLSASTPAREVILIIDTSGSMEGTSIVQAKEAVQLALERLKPTDRFNVIEFNSTAASLFRVPREASTENIHLAERYVDQLNAEGGTEMRAALELAFQTPPAEDYLGQVVFMTDGSVGNETELFELIERELGKTRLFTVGIGSAPNSYFMRKAAEFGRGTYTFISDLSETQEKMSGLFVKLEQPVLTGLELQLPAGSEVFPATIPDLYVGEPVVISVKLDGNGEAVLTGNVNGEPWTRQLSLASTVSEQGISQLWARAKIEELSDAMIRSGDTQLEQEITTLALHHHLVTDYTSLVAVDKTPVRPTDEPLQSEDMPQNLPLGQDYDAIFEVEAVPVSANITVTSVGFANTATPAPLNLLIGIVAIMLALLLTVWARARSVSVTIRSNKD